MKLSERFARGAGMQLVKWVLGLLFVGAAGLYAADRLFGPDTDVALARFRADSVATSRRVDSLLVIYADSVSALKDSVATLTVVEAGLRQRADGLVVTARTLRRDLSKAASSIDSIRLYVETIQVQDSTIAVCGLRVLNCKAQRRLDSLTIKIEREAKDSVVAELDSLRSVTVDLVEATNDCKYGQMNLLLVHPCNPSPTLMFFIGAAAGVGLGCWATHCLTSEPPTMSITVTFPEDDPPPNPEGDY